MTVISSTTSSSAIATVSRNAIALCGAVRDHRRGGGQHSWDLVVVGPGPLGSTAALAALREPGSPRADAGRRGLPARQGLRRRHRPARSGRPRRTSRTDIVGAEVNRRAAAIAGVVAAAVISALNLFGLVRTATS